MAATTLIAKPTFLFLRSNLLKPNPLNPLLLNPPNRFQPCFLRSDKLPELNLGVNDSKPSTLNISLKQPIITKIPELANLILIHDDANNTVDDDDVDVDVVVDMSSSKEIQEENKEARKRDPMGVPQAIQNPAAAAAVLLVSLIMLFMHDVRSALAASGGSMGGDSFSSSSSYSNNENECSYSSWASSSLSGGGEEDSSRFSYSQVVDGGGNTRGAHSQAVDGEAFIFVCWCLLIVFLINPRWFKGPKLQNARKIVATERTSILRLQVGLLGPRRSLQRDLNKIAETADTSTKKGLSYILTETIVALLRYPDYWSSAYSSADVKDNTDEGETRFKELSIEERAKLDEETLVNVNGMKKRSSTIKRISGVSNEHIVVTILVAAKGEHKISTINCGSDLKEALQKLASIGSSKTLAVRVLWTPQNEDDVLSEQELLQNYSLLRPL